MKRYVGIGYTVYIHKNLTNGKVYIGQTKCEDLTRRWTGGNGYKDSPHFNRAIKKYGWSGFTHEVLETGLTKKQADDKERFYIALYNSTNQKYGYNIQYGGQERGEMSAEAKERIKAMFSGKNSPVAKAVDIYDKDGNFIKTTTTLNEAAKFCGVGVSRMSTVCKKMDGTANGYLCHYHERTKGMPRLPDELIFKKGDMRRLNKAVAQYDLEGNLIKIYSSIKEAAEKTGTKRTEISSCLSNKSRQTSNYYMWRNGENAPNKIKPSEYKYAERGKDIKCKPVLQIDPTTKEVIKEYPSVKEAAEALNTTKTSISRACLGKVQTCKKFIWKHK